MLFFPPQKLFSLFLVVQQNGFIRRIRLISKFMTSHSQPGQQTIVIHILPNISRSKGNQTMKFGQLIECNMRNIFLEKSYTKCGGETIPRPFSKKSKLSISLDQQSKVLCNKLRTIVYCIHSILKLSCRPLAFPSDKTFLRNNKTSGNASFSA